MARTIVLSQQLSKRIYTQMNACVAKVRSLHFLLKKTNTVEEMVMYPFCTSDSSHCFSPSFLFTFFPFYSCFLLILLLHLRPFPPHPPPYQSLSFPSLLSSAAASLFPLLSCQLPGRQCCHGYRAAGQIS